MYCTGRHNARKNARLVFNKLRALAETADAANSHALWLWQRHVYVWILEWLTGYGVRNGHLSVVALFFVGFGMWMFWSNDALVEAEPTASSMAPGGTLSASTAPPGGQSSYEWAHELFGHLFHRLDFGSRGKLAGGAPLPKDWPVK
jgi:hypothetical protein